MTTNIKTNVKQDLTIEQHNLLLAQIENLKEVKNKIIVERDKLNVELNKLGALLDALKVVTD